MQTNLHTQLLGGGGADRGNTRVSLRARSLSLLFLSWAWRDLNSRILLLPMLPWPSGILVLASQVWSMKSMQYRRWALGRNILLQRKGESRILCGKRESPWEWDSIKWHHLGVKQASLDGVWWGDELSVRLVVWCRLLSGSQVSFLQNGRRHTEHLPSLLAYLTSGQGRTEVILFSNILASTMDEATGRTRSVSSFSQGNAVHFGCSVPQNTYPVSKSFSYQSGFKKDKMIGCRLF